MRISDWSSDVCSSDLKTDPHDAAGLAQLARTGFYKEVHVKSPAAHGVRSVITARSHLVEARVRLDNTIRSEEHTSELQSLMRISYAVFCLKKKKNHTTSHLCRQYANHVRMKSNVTRKNLSTHK